VAVEQVQLELFQLFDNTNCGGAGVSNSITGSSVNYAGGGNASGAQGNSFGGGDGEDYETGDATAGATNKGAGGGATWSSTTAAGKNGGSGVVILRYPNTNTITIGAGLTGSTATDGSFKVSTITAGTGNVSWV
jgi:hypothetical protein